MQVNKLKISREEINVMLEQDFFILKDSATKKIIELFGSLERELKVEVEKSGLNYDGLNISSGKIFRGENYKLFPYIVLDYPRLFSKNSIFAFRTLFWWGHEFSFTMHLQGEALDKYQLNLIKNFDKLYNKEVYFCINDTPWQYHFGKDNYELIDNLKREINVFKRPFIKLSRKMGINEYEDLDSFSLETFRIFCKVLK